MDREKNHCILFGKVSSFRLFSTCKFHFWRDADWSNVVQPLVPFWWNWVLAVDQIGKSTVVQSTTENAQLKRKKKGKRKEQKRERKGFVC